MANKYSDHKIVWFPAKLEAMRLGQVTAPICVRVKPTNRCCHDCNFCVYKPAVSGMHPSANRQDEIPEERLLALMTELAGFGVKGVTFSGGGEPLLHPAIGKAMRLLLNDGVDISIITNGQLLCGDTAVVLCQAKWIRVSMDYVSAEMMQQTRGAGAAFAQVRQNIEWFREHKRAECDLSVNFIVTRENHLHLRAVTDMLWQWGVEIVRFSPLWTPRFIEYHAPIKEAVTEQLAELHRIDRPHFKVYDSYRVLPEIYQRSRRCYFCEIVPVIAADQNVYACHNKAYDPSGCLGSIAAQPFAALWKSVEVHCRLHNINPRQSCPHQCANQNKNLFIEDLMASHGDNFV